MWWDLSVGFHPLTKRGLRSPTRRNAQPGGVVETGRLLVVGNEEADPAVAEVVSVEDRGVVLVRGFTRTVGRPCRSGRIEAESLGRLIHTWRTPYEAEVLLSAAAARRLGVATRSVIKAMYERTLACVRLDDGTLGISAGALVGFDAEAG
jgi:hypothetical protein